MQPIQFISVGVALLVVGCSPATAPEPTVRPVPPTPTQFVCPITKPNQKAPPGENPPYDGILGNEEGTLWTGLWPDGEVIFAPGGPGSLEPNGGLGMKFWWWRLPNGAPLTIEGRRLDGDAPPITAEIPDGYAGAFQATGIIFGSAGCWEVTGRMGDSHLTFVTEVVIDCPEDKSHLTQAWKKLCPSG